MAFDPKDILSKHFSVIASKMVGMKYTSDIVMHAFEYYATLQLLINRFRQDFQLATLRRKTSKVLNLNEKSFFAICILYS